MKRQMVLAFVAVLVVGAVAQAATSQVDVLLGPIENGFTSVSSRSWSAAYNGLGAGSDVLDGPNPTYVSGSTAFVPGATGYGETGWASQEGSWVAAGASAAAAGVESAGAYGQAYQYLLFYVAEDAVVTFDVPYEIAWNVNSGGPGGTAFFDAQINAVLYVSVFDELTNEPFWYELDNVLLTSFTSYVENGGVDSDSIFDSLTVSGAFYGGETGCLLLYTDAQATATVPAPGAILLGVLGTGLVGAWRRRKAL